MKVLLIAAEDALRERIRRRLRQEGLQIQVASNGEQAISQARNLHPDLLLLQVNLLDINGLEVCRQLRSNPLTSLFPILMLSEKDDWSEPIFPDTGGSQLPAQSGQGKCTATLTDVKPSCAFCAMRLTSASLRGSV
jgi:CheY-like chemotaxis protein